MKRLNVFTLLTLMSLTQYGQIIADHTVIDKFDDIPAYYINEAKKMLIAFPGESHSAAYRRGMELLEATNPVYACNVGTAEAYTTDYVRVENYGWTGEYVFWMWYALSPRPTPWLKNDITAYKNAGHPFNVLGFGWCNDMATSDHISSGVDPVYGVRWYGRSELGPDGDNCWGLDAGDNSITGNRVNLTTYFGAMEELIAHCAANSPTTKMVFTTGPVDVPAGEWIGECGYQGHLKHEAIRSYVKANTSRILFDYADILCYNDDGTTATQTWNGHTYPGITSLNLGDESIGHIGSAGAIRLAKAQWWLLARLAGWDGGTTGINDTNDENIPGFRMERTTDEIIIRMSDSVSTFKVSLFDITGMLLKTWRGLSESYRLNTSSLKPGIYLIVVLSGNKKYSEKIIIA